MNNQYVKDAEKLLDFFKNDEIIYNRDFIDRGSVYFCLTVLGLERFNIEEIELASDSLNSIVSIISRNISKGMQSEFLSTVRDSINRYVSWLKAVYNHKIDENSCEVLFNKSEFSSNLISKIGDIKEIPNDFFTLVTKFNDKKILPVQCAELDNVDNKKDSATDIILLVNDEVTYIYNDIPWTDRNKIWIGDSRMLNIMLSGKYRKVRDKFLVGVIKSLHDKFGDNILFKTIVVNPDVSFRKGSNISIEVNSDDSDRFAVIKKGD